jgi:ferredoxin--NADP+ reductase
MTTAVSTEKYTRETITWWKQWTPNLFSFRTTRSPSFRFAPGQFARLGVEQDGKIVSRAYSIVSANYDDYLEFYSIVVPGGEFTSRLARLREGDPLLVDKVAYGFLTTDRFENGKDLWMLATGTGLAPFISILYDFTVWEQYENLIVVHCVREPAELAYRDTIQGFAGHEYFRDLGAKLHYVPIVTRSEVPGALRERITTLLADGGLERHVGLPLDHERSRLMLCGNPQMVDDTRAVLNERGFRLSRRAAPGHYAVEQYW